MKLREVLSHDQSRVVGYSHLCPGCKNSHVIYIEQADIGRHHATWRFNGNLEKPSFTPSVKSSYDVFKENEKGELVRDRLGHPIKLKTVITCHYILTDGVIDYCQDSGHELRGQKVPLPDFPEEEV